MHYSFLFPFLHLFKPWSSRRIGRIQIGNILETPKERRHLKCFFNWDRFQGVPVYKSRVLCSKFSTGPGRGAQCEWCKRNQEMWLLVPVISKLPLWPLAHHSAFWSGSSFLSNDRIKIDQYIWTWTHPVSTKNCCHCSSKNPYLSSKIQFSHDSVFGDNGVAMQEKVLVLKRCMPEYLAMKRQDVYN